MANVFLVSPLMDENMKRGMAAGFYQNATQKHRLYGDTFGSSLIPLNCNFLLCQVLDQMKELELQWLAMIHSDVAPPLWWIDTLIDEAGKHGADFMSAVIPLKNNDGVLSTAIAKPDTEYGHFCYITTHQVMCNNFPVTFGIKEAVAALRELPTGYSIEAPQTYLLCNTGCMVCRLDRPWFQARPPKVWFHDLNGIEVNQTTGKLQPKLLSEDWYFSRRIAEEGGKVMATKAVIPGHYGQYIYKADKPWGHAVAMGQ